MAAYLKEDISSIFEPKQHVAGAQNVEWKGKSLTWSSASQQPKPGRTAVLWH